jgi:hypothetical protein
MNARRPNLTLVVALALTVTAVAQNPQGATGFSLTTNPANGAGSFCWWFICTPATLNVTAGELATLRISGEYQAAYMLGVSTTATNCLAYPGIFNSLVIDFPIAIVGTGTLSSPPVPGCPNGYTQISSVVPSGLPLGTTLAIQALTYGAGNVLAFTGAIVITIV